MRLPDQPYQGDIICNRMGKDSNNHPQLGEPTWTCGPVDGSSPNHPQLGEPTIPLFPCSHQSPTTRGANKCHIQKKMAPIRTRTPRKEENTVNRNLYSVMRGSVSLRIHRNKKRQRIYPAKRPFRGLTNAQFLA